MRVQLITRGGTRGPSKKTIVADWLRVGRNASCEIHLPDPRVPLEHGMIANREGLVYLEGEAGNQNITRKSVKSLRLQHGVPFDVGPYRLTLQSPPQGFDAAISVELARPLESGVAFGERTSRLTLQSLGIPKRATAWAWGLTVVAIFLALPAGRVLDLPWREAAAHMGIGDRFWNPGKVMLAHQPIEQKCASCHEVAFEHVKDRACLECHRTIGQHVGPALQKASLFEGERCTSCHRDHKGPKPTHRDDDRFCVDCHRDIQAKVPGSKLANVGDFGRDHPAFAVPKSHEPNLKFPHATHLDPAGVRSPVQGRMKLDCGSCHALDSSKRSFKPVSMVKNCQECHQLQFEPAVTTREVPHGNAAEVLQVVEEFYATLALRGTRDSFQKAFGVPGEGLLRRTGDPGAGERQNALALATRKAKQVGNELFETRVCATCHEVERQGEGWKITPVKAAVPWMARAHFDHNAHKQSACGDCHDVAHSEQSSDVAMPAIKTCRDCHGGSRAAVGKVTSNCLLCHGFHDAKHPWDPAMQARGVRQASSVGREAQDSAR